MRTPYQPATRLHAAIAITPIFLDGVNMLLSQSPGALFGLEGDAGVVMDDGAGLLSGAFSGGLGADEDEVADEDAGTDGFGAAVAEGFVSADGGAIPGGSTGIGSNFILLASFDMDVPPDRSPFRGEGVMF